MIFFASNRGLNDEASRSLSDSNQADSGWPFLFQDFFWRISACQFGLKARKTLATLVCGDQ
jgi:hypothetical protein